MGAGTGNISDLVIQTNGEESHSSVRLYCRLSVGRLAVANVGVGSTRVGVESFSNSLNLDFVLPLVLSRASSDKRR